jgi:hypothetical protein
MFISESASMPATATPVGGAGTGVALRLARVFVIRWNRHRSLMPWNRNLERPACCAHLSSRAWCRHSAILTLRAGGQLK